MPQAPRLRIDPTATVPTPVQGREERAVTLSLPAPAASPVLSGVRMMLSGGLLAVGLTVGVGLMEYANPRDEFKPSYLIGTLGGRLAAAEMKAAEQAKSAFTEGVKSGELRAQIVYDEKLLKLQLEKESAFATLQADLDRTSKAYEALYQVGMLTAQAAMTAEADLARIRATTVAQSQGMRSFAANVGDLIGILGTLGGDSQLASVNGDAFRNQIASSITSAGTAGTGAFATRLLTQFPSPAEFRLHQERTLQTAFRQAP